jgi:hypothetical protein
MTTSVQKPAAVVMIPSGRTGLLIGYKGTVIRHIASTHHCRLAIKSKTKEEDLVEITHNNRSKPDLPLLIDTINRIVYNPYVWESVIRTAPVHIDAAILFSMVFVDEENIESNIRNLQRLRVSLENMSIFFLTLVAPSPRWKYNPARQLLEFAQKLEIPIVQSLTDADIIVSTDHSMFQYNIPATIYTGIKVEDGIVLIRKHPRYEINDILPELQTLPLPRMPSIP